MLLHKVCSDILAVVYLLPHDYDFIHELPVELDGMCLGFLLAISHFVLICPPGASSAWQGLTL
jgi:hypothetical protein